MRGRLLLAWPELSYHFDLHPWDLPRLTEPELEQYLYQLDQIRKRG